MLGNDVIDLQDLDARPESYRGRFDARVFSAGERRAIAHDDEPLARRWAHWGAKEAAYKLAKQIDSGFVFSPGKLIARFEPVAEVVRGRLERRGRLELPDGGVASLRWLELRSFETVDWVHVLALPAGSDWDAVDFGLKPLAEVAVDSSTLDSSTVDANIVDSSTVDASSADANRGRDAAAAHDPSTVVRAMAIREIGRSLGVETGRLSIGRRGKIPIVELDGARTSLSLSLSHHGRFVGYAMTPRMDMDRGLDPEMDRVVGAKWKNDAIDGVGRTAAVEWQRS